MNVSAVSYFYMFASAIVFIGIACFIPKRMFISEIYITSLFCEVLQVFTDTIFSVKYDWYGYFIKGPDVFGAIVVLTIYPAINIIYLNFFPYQKNYYEKAKYILAWSIFALFYEWTSILSGYFYYRSWYIWYSAPFYPFLFALLAWHYNLIRKFIRKRTEDKSSNSSVVDSP